MARNVVTQGQLVRIEGMEAVLGNISKVLDRTKGKNLKKLYVKAAAVVSDQVRANISGLNASPELKEVLTASVVTNAGPEHLPNAISAMKQQAAIRRLGKGRSIPNPKWFEYGTADRRTKSGRFTGKITPTPVFRPAVKQAREKVKQVLVDGLREEILR